MIEDFINNNEVVFEMRATVNGEEVVKWTSDISFDDVSGFAYLADEAFDQYVRDQKSGSKEMSEDDLMELEREN